MNRKILLIGFVCAFLLLASCGDDAAIMPAKVCQTTCTDDVTGDTYGIAFRAIAWNNEADGIGENEYGCYYYIDAYRGKIEESSEFEPNSKFWTSGLMGAEESYSNDYTLAFFDNNFDTTPTLVWPSYDPLEDYLLYQLLDESTIQIEQTSSSISAKYIHKINNCILDSQLTLSLSCSRIKKGYAAAECTGTTSPVDKVYCNGCGENEEIKCPPEAGGDCTSDINYEDIDSGIQSIIQAIKEETS